MTNTENLTKTKEPRLAAVYDWRPHPLLFHLLKRTVENHASKCSTSYTTLRWKASSRAARRDFCISKFPLVLFLTRSIMDETADLLFA